MDKAQSKELSMVSRAAEVTASTLMALRKAIEGLLDQDMDIIAVPDEQAMMTEKQRSFLQHLYKVNCLDKGELNIKLEQLDSGLTKQEADLLIKQYV